MVTFRKRLSGTKREIIGGEKLLPVTKVEALPMPEEALVLQQARVEFYPRGSASKVPH